MANNFHTQTIIGEARSVMATMRLNSRFSTSFAMQTGSSESPLLTNFKQQISVLTAAADLQSLDSVKWMAPFLDVVQSEDTSGPITGAALSSIYNFLILNIIQPKTPSASKLIANIADTVTHCRFEATDPDGDEAVLMKILRVLLACLRSNVGFLLPDALVFEMLQTCFRMSIQPRLSELLRRTAEHTMAEMVHTIFNIHGATNKSSSNNSNNAVATKAQPNEATQLTTTTQKSQEHDEYVNRKGVHFHRTEEVAEGDVKPHGVGSLVRVFQLLCQLLNPDDETNTNSVRTLALNLLATLSTHSSLVTNPQLATLATNDLCKYLTQNIHSGHLTILNNSMRVMFNLYLLFGCPQLHMQLEIFFSNTLEILKDPDTHYDRQEIALENIVEFFRQPQFATDLYIYYDCNVHATNLLANICKFLHKNSSPLNGALYSIHMLSLESLLTIINNLAAQCNEISQNIWPSGNFSALPSVACLNAQKRLKNKLKQAAELFNTKGPKASIAFLQQEKLLPQQKQLKPCHVARFLYKTPLLDKKIMGEYLGSSKEFNIAVLENYGDNFMFRQRSFPICLRQFITSFRMPGEAQIIARVLEVFAKRYCEAFKDCVFKNEDAAYVLAYSVVLLHVDHHNANVKRKMTQEEYINSVRGINDGDNLPVELLADIYLQITTTEIEIPETTIASYQTSASWNYLLQRNAEVQDCIFSPVPPFFGDDEENSEKLCESGFESALQDTTSNTEGSIAYTKDIFITVCRTAIAAVSIDNSSILQNSINAFLNCARIASHFQLSEVFDNVVVSLCKFTTLERSNSKRNFGRNKKAQKATETAFYITRVYGDHLREGWRDIISCILTLNSMDLLPELIDQSEGLAIPARKKLNKQANITNSGGLWSWFYTSAAAEEEVEEVDSQDLKAEEAAKTCVNACKVNEIINGSKNLQADSLVFLIKGLIIKSVLPQRNGRVDQSPKKQTLQQESNAVFCLELLTNITLLNQDRIIFVWVLVYEHFAGIIQSATVPSLHIEKAIICLLLLCVKLINKPNITNRILSSLAIFLNLAPAVAEEMLETIAVGMSKILENNIQHITVKGWTTIYSLLKNCAKQPGARDRAFAALTALLSNKEIKLSKAITQDTFHNCFDAFASFAKAKGTCDMSKSAIECMYNLLEIIPVVVPKTDENASEEDYQIYVLQKFRLPALTVFRELCRDSRHEVRYHAINFLQKSLLSPFVLSIPPAGISLCFESIVFPLLGDLLKPFSNTPKESQHIVAINTEETRVRAISLLSNVFLQYLQQNKASLATLTVLYAKLWFQVLSYIEMYMSSDHGGFLADATKEALKNILLVMIAEKVFKSEKGKAMWQQTWESVSRFCPNLQKDESFLEPLQALKDNTVLPPSPHKHVTTARPSMLNAASAPNLTNQQHSPNNQNNSNNTNVPAANIRSV